MAKPQENGLHQNTARRAPVINSRHPAGMLFIWGMMALTLLGLVSETLSGIALRKSMLADRALKQGRATEALTLSSEARTLAPYEQKRLYTQMVAQKELNRWEALAETGRKGREWTPAPGPLSLLWGEALYRTGAPPEQTAQVLWEALRLTPRPPESGSRQYWWLLMNEGKRAWGITDGRVRAAATQLLAILREEASNTEYSAPPEQVAKMRQEANRVLSHHGQNRAQERGGSSSVSLLESKSL